MRGGRREGGQGESLEARRGERREDRKGTAPEGAGPEKAASEGAAPEGAAPEGAAPERAGLRQALAAALAMTGATFFFAMMDSTAKYLGASYAVPQIVFVRYATHLALMVVLLGCTRRLIATAKSRRPGIQLLRSGVLVATTGAFFLALRSLPLAEAIGVMMLSPVLTTLLSALFLRERVERHRWAAVAAACAGALIVARPGGAVFQAAGLAALLAAFLYAVYQILTRRLAGVDGQATTLLYSASVGTLLLLPTAPFWWEPFARADMLFAMAMGVYAIGAHGLLYLAYARAPASLAAPFGYTGIFWATLFGWVIFGDLPDWPTFAGIAVIVAGGLYILWREAAQGLPPSGPPRPGPPPEKAAA